MHMHACGWVGVDVHVCITIYVCFKLFVCWGGGDVLDAYVSMYTYTSIWVPRLGWVGGGGDSNYVCRQARD